MPAPCGLDKDDGLLEVVAHEVPELQLDPRAARRAEADGERAMAIEKLDEDVVAHDPLVVLAQMREEIFRLGIGGLEVEQLVRRLSLHVRLPGENEDLDGLLAGVQ